MTDRPQRLSLQGISGSGKTTLGRELERRLGLRHLETDALVHGPDWTETPDGELRALLEGFMASGLWVIDSDYRRKVGTMVLESADTVVWLDMPLRLCLHRLYRRTSRGFTATNGSGTTTGSRGGLRSSAGIRCSCTPCASTSANGGRFRSSCGSPT